VSGRGAVARPRTLVSGLAGATQGRLLTLKNGAMLAAVATERGVWVVQSARANRFGGQHLLTRGGLMPETLDAAWLGGQNTIVAWTGANADTLVTLEIFHQASGLVFAAGSAVLGSSSGTGSATAQAPNGTCTQFLDHLPPDVTIPPGIACQRETTTATATGNFNGGTFTLASQAIKGIRIEGQTGGG